MYKSERIENSKKIKKKFNFSYFCLVGSEKVEG